MEFVEAKRAHKSVNLLSRAPSTWPKPGSDRLCSSGDATSVTSSVFAMWAWWKPLDFLFYDGLTNFRAVSLCGEEISRVKRIFEKRKKEAGVREWDLGGSNGICLVWEQSQIAWNVKELSRRMEWFETLWKGIGCIQSP